MKKTEKIPGTEISATPCGLENYRALSAVCNNEQNRRHDTEQTTKQT